jgi:prophage regulatory protein
MSEVMAFSASKGPSPWALSGNTHLPESTHAQRNGCVQSFAGEGEVARRTTNDTQPARRILRRRQVESLTGLSRSTIYQRMSVGTFPRRISLGIRSVGWLASDVDEWIEACVAKS